MHTSKKIRLAELLPPDLLDGVGTFELSIPEWAFSPDQWSFAFLRGLLKLELDGLHLWEVGCGTGLNLIMLRRQFPQVQLRFSDFNPRCAPLSMLHLARSGETENTEALYGEWDLVTNHDCQITPGPVDVIVACIPQVPKNGRDLTVGDNYAHYYDPDQYGEARLNAVGLGLNEALLVRAPQVLKPGGRVVLNLGGRPGLHLLCKMFLDRGFEPRVIHTEMIPQHRETSLATLAKLEKSGQPDFEFFADEAGEQPVNAREAEGRRKDDLPLFHCIYIIEGKLLQ